MSASYRVTGMTCQGCVKAVTNAIKAATPDTEIRVDLSAGTVTVGDNVEAAKLAAAIEGAGFGFGGRA